MVTVKRIFSHSISIFTLLILFVPTIVNANIMCNDGSISPSCGDCHRGCCSHHGGCSSDASSNSSSSSGTTNNYSNHNSPSGNNNDTTQYPTIKEEPKSNDVSLKKVTIDYKDINISDNMSYLTTQESAIIYAVANDDKATTEYNRNAELTIGDNIIDIKVIAENGNTKEYKLDIIREKVLSNNKNIKVIIDGKEVVFDAFKRGKIYIDNSKNKIDIKYELEDKNAKAEIIGNEELKVGKNEVTVKVTAENGEELDYIIIVEKQEKTEESVFNTIAIMFVIGLFGGIVSLTYFSNKKIKKYKQLNNYLRESKKK